MKTWCAGFLILSVVLTARAQEEKTHRDNAAALRQFSSSLRILSAKVSSSVVQVVGTGFEVEEDAEHAGVNILSKHRSVGSGVIVSEDGSIITNAHVIEGARSIRVRLNAEGKPRTRVFDAKLVGMDRQTDLALLKIDALGLAPLPFGDSLELKKGELVLAFGSPLEMENSVSMGVVSAVARQLSEDDSRIYVQTDAAINPGSSGGPLVDASGSLVGINTFIISRSGGNEGVGFAIPSNVVRYVYSSLSKDGRVHHGYIGIRGRTITEPLASAFDLEPETGVLVEDVLPGGPAWRAGLQVGDAILSLDGTSLHNVRDLDLQLYQYAIGDMLKLDVLRHQKIFDVRIVVTDKADDTKPLTDIVSPLEHLIPQLGLLGVTIDETVGETLPLRIPDGVLVAAHSGLSLYFGDEPKEGDLIHAVNGEHVSSVAELRWMLNRLRSTQPLVLQVERNSSLMFLVLESN